AVGHVEVEPLPGDRFLGRVDEVRSDAVAGAARAGVEHDPHPVVLVEANLDEVVAAAHRAKLAAGLAVDLRMAGDDLAPALFEPVVPCACDGVRGCRPAALGMVGGLTG